VAYDISPLKRQLKKIKAGALARALKFENLTIENEEIL
jgi:hypothetical protein